MLFATLKTIQWAKVTDAARYLCARIYCMLSVCHFVICFQTLLCAQYEIISLDGPPTLDKLFHCLDVSCLFTASKCSPIWNANPVRVEPVCSVCTCTAQQRPWSSTKSTGADNAVLAPYSWRLTWQIHKLLAQSHLKFRFFENSICKSPKATKLIFSPVILPQSELNAVFPKYIQLSHCSFKPGAEKTSKP